MVDKKPPTVALVRSYIACAAAVAAYSSMTVETAIRLHVDCAQFYPRALHTLQFNHSHNHAVECKILIGGGNQ